MRAALFLVALVLAGCGPSASEKWAQERISAAARASWSEGIYVAGLADSLRLCATVLSRDCIKVEGKAQAVADAVASCSGNGSTLCLAVSNTKSLLQFKGGSASPLPAHPFYWSLGNELLDAQAPAFSYRREMFDGWRDRWRVVLLSALCTILAAIVGWVSWIWRQAVAEQQAQAEAARKAKEVRQKSEQDYDRAEAARKAQEATTAAAEAQARADAHRQQEEATRAAQAQKAAVEAAAQAEAQQVKEATAAALAAAFGKWKKP